MFPVYSVTYVADRSGKLDAAPGECRGPSAATLAHTGSAEGPGRRTAPVRAERSAQAGRDDHGDRR